MGTANKSAQLRGVAADVIHQVLQHRRSLQVALAQGCEKLSPIQHPLLKEICFGTLRLKPLLEWYLKQLLHKCLPKEPRRLKAILLIGLYQLEVLRIPKPLMISATVEATAFVAPHHKNLVNAVLRNFLRKKEMLTQRAQQEAPLHLHPEWFLGQLKKAYSSEQIAQILSANNAQPPLWLRLNLQKQTLKTYTQELDAKRIAYEAHIPSAILLKHALPVQQIPGFAQGIVSVQDFSAQQCAHWLNPQDKERILDACAAPGGKTSHILDVAPRAQVTALDIDADRLVLLQEQLTRCGQTATIFQLDAQLLPCTQLFDCILLDAPCSGSGVIRRHPDIKWLRLESDIQTSVLRQEALLHSLWKHLVPSGRLLYSTCSIFPQENTQQIAQFLKDCPTARLLAQKQFLPELVGGDGFFCALLQKIIH